MSWIHNSHSATQIIFSLSGIIFSTKRMTVIIGVNLIEAPILASDSRSTGKNSKKVSDTATKIIPLTNYLCAGICGNPRQAAAILQEIHKHWQDEGDSVLHPKYLLENIGKIAEDVLPVDPNYSRCIIVFAGIDPNEKQIVPMSKILEYFNKENKQFTDGREGVALTMTALSSKGKGNAEFNFPKSYLFTYTFPTNEVKKIDILEHGFWGSGAKLVEDSLGKEMYKLWGLSGFPKPMIFAMNLSELIKEKGESVGIGGLAQVVSVTATEGVVFHGYAKQNLDGETELAMKFENGVWHQVNSKGEIIKTLPSLLSSPTFDPSEIVNFLDEN